MNFTYRTSSVPARGTGALRGSRDEIVETLLWLILSSRIFGKVVKGFGCILSVTVPNGVE